MPRKDPEDPGEFWDAPGAGQGREKGVFVIFPCCHREPDPDMWWKTEGCGYPFVYIWITDCAWLQLSHSSSSALERSTEQLVVVTAATVTCIHCLVLAAPSTVFG